MKKLSLLLLAFAVLPGFTLIENQTHDITLNGKQLGRGVVIQGGIIAISVQDFARAAGAGVTLEPAFQLQGNRLQAAGAHSDYLKYKENAALKYGDASGQYKIKIMPGQIIAVRKAGLISGNVMTVDGKAYIPLRDVLRAFGDGSVRGFGGDVKPGEAIHLTANPNATNGILVGL